MPLDRGSAESLQEQICAGLRQLVSSGALGPGTRLPSTRALAAELDVSRTTAVAALLQLVEEGYLVARERSGTFVAADAAEATRPEGRRPSPAAPAAPTATSPLTLSRRGDELARAATALHSHDRRPRAFRVGRPALDAFPVREWSRILARRAARVTIAQLDYGEPSPELCAAIAELVSSARGMRVRTEQVLLFAGGQRALEFAVTAVLDPGEEAWMEDPGYPGARNVLGASGARITSVPVDDQGMIVAAGEAAAPRARLVFVTPSCQFPLGVTMSDSRRRELLAWAERAGACVVEDDYDAEFRHEGAQLAPLAALDPDRVLYTGSFSRTMFPAIRLGYLIAPVGMVERLRAAQAVLEDQLPWLFQVALADFIAEGHFARHLRRMRVLYRARREAVLAAALAAGDRMRVRPSSSGLHLIADLPAGVDGAAVAAAAARRGVEAAPLSLFHADPRPRAALVLGFGAVDAASARAAMDELAAAIDQAGS